jgi:hypothetical protein
MHCDIRSTVTFVTRGVYREMLLRRQRFWLVLGRWPVQISAGISTILVQGFRGFPGKHVKLRHDGFLPHSLQFITHQSSPFGAIYTELLTAQLIKSQINEYNCTRNKSTQRLMRHVEQPRMRLKSSLSARLLYSPLVLTCTFHTRCIYTRKHSDREKDQPRDCDGLTPLQPSWIRKRGFCNEVCRHVCMHRCAPR